MKRQYPTPTPADLEALQLFADTHGRYWKDQLSGVYWYNARPWRGPHGQDEATGARLHAIRNDFGPTWLYDVCAIAPTPKPKKAETYRLSSTPLIHSPGLIRWGINGYAFPSDRKAILKVFTSGWPTVPPSAFRAILAGKLPVVINDDAGTVEFTWSGKP